MDKDKKRKKPLLNLKRKPVQPILETEYQDKPQKKHESKNKQPSAHHDNTKVTGKELVEYVHLWCQKGFPVSRLSIV
jgi:hypothetical protein